MSSSAQKKESRPSQPASASSTTTTGKLPFGESSSANVPPTSAWGGKQPAAASTKSAPSSRYNYRSLGIYKEGRKLTGKPTLGQLSSAGKRFRRDRRQPTAFRRRRHNDNETLVTFESLRNRFWAGLLYPLSDLELEDLRRTADFEVIHDEAGPIERGSQLVDRVKQQAQRMATAVGDTVQKIVHRTEEKAPNLVAKARHGVEMVTGKVMKSRDTVSGRLFGPRFKQTWSSAGPLVADYIHPYPKRNAGLRLPTVGWSQTLQTRLAAGKIYKRGENTDLMFFSHGAATDEAWFGKGLGEAFSKKNPLDNRDIGGRFSGSSAAPFRNDDKIGLLQGLRSERGPAAKTTRSRAAEGAEKRSAEAAPTMPVGHGGSPGLRREF